jgi:hypothetical protein
MASEKKKASAKGSVRFKDLKMRRNPKGGGNWRSAGGPGRRGRSDREPEASMVTLCA